MPMRRSKSETGLRPASLPCNAWLTARLRNPGEAAIEDGDRMAPALARRQVARIAFPLDPAR